MKARDTIGLVRRDACHKRHETHAGKKKDLDDQATCRMVSALNVSHDDPGKPQSVNQDERQEVVIT
ncbi:hypothetical protein A4U53_009850 [Rhizobium ruizarguesonis]|uniref:Uncharacterized protein n=1 Tax=Rhizobium ruizarguesonis TaxID=2081791 RepID=A0ACD5EPL6_9HYPH